MMGFKGVLKAELQRLSNVKGEGSKVPSPILPVKGELEPGEKYMVYGEALE